MASVFHQMLAYLHRVSRGRLAGAFVPAAEGVSLFVERPRDAGAKAPRVSCFSAGLRRTNLGTIRCTTKGGKEEEIHYVIHRHIGACSRPFEQLQRRTGTQPCA